MLWKDLRYGVRTLRKSPGFAIAAILVLALGIGANTAIFSIVNSVLLRPLPFQDSARLLSVLHTPPQDTFPGIPVFAVSPANYLDWERENHVFEAMSPYQTRGLTRNGTNRPEVVIAGVVSSGFFSMLKVQPQLGRVFLPEEDLPGRGNAIVLSYAFWRDQFGSRPSAIGEKFLMDGKSFTVVGVMPPSFTVAAWAPAAAQAWIPLAWSEQERAVRGNHNYQVVARLKNGVSLKQAQAEMDTISRRLEQQYPVEDKGWGSSVIPLHERLVGSVRPALLVLLGAVVFVLLIACANVANLVLARTLGRRKEMAIRAALGASRPRAIRQMLSETVLLALAGGAVGLLVAKAAILGILAFLARQLPRATEVSLDGWVLVFTLGISIATGLVAGLAPAFQFGRTDLSHALKQGLGKTDSDSGGGRMRGALVVAEVALSLILLMGAGLMIRSLWLLQAADLGFDPSHVQTMSISLPRAKYASPVQARLFFEQVFQKIRALPGVAAAGGIDGLPLQGGSVQTVAIEGRAVAKSDEPAVAARVITPGYFAAMRIRLERGRQIADADVADRTPVALISSSMAKHLWPNQDPIGQHITLLFEPKIARMIVGIVADVKQQGVDLAPVDTVYSPFAQSAQTGLTLTVRTVPPPENLVAAISSAVHDVDREQPLRFVNTMESVVANSLSQRRFSMLLLSAFAGLALLLATVGIYSVLSYSAKRQMREVSIRIALGADRRRIVWLLVAEGMKPTLLGLALGAGGAIALRRVVQNLIFGVSPSDPLTFAAVAAFLTCAALMACLAPAFRATRVDPIQALREE
ncbi:MAG TPA: ABC transporter permease [Bryobacteraceae bacterium]|nr:ABC transporter permease [Bryobacteraceae bacterium]